MHLAGNAIIGMSTLSGLVEPAEALVVIGNLSINDTNNDNNILLDPTKDVIRFTGENGSLYQPVYGTDDDLVLYLPFSEDSVDTSTQFDRSPYGNDGTCVGVAAAFGCNWTTGKYGNALFFDGTDDCIILFSKNAAGADTVRFKIGTGADTASIRSGAANWHFDSNIVYAHDIRNNDNNPIIIRGNSQSGDGFKVHTSGASPAYADTARLTISSAQATATATWSDITHSGFVSTEITMANEWRLMESELYNDYPKGFAIGHSSKWDIGDTIWMSDNKEELMKDEVPVFAVTDEWLEFRGHRYTPQDYEKRISELEKKLAELSGDE